MSAMPIVFEGTWEDLVKRSEDFTGHRLRVTVLDGSGVASDHPMFNKSPEGIAAWLKMFREHNESRTDIRLADDALDALYNEQLDHQR